LGNTPKGGHAKAAEVAETGEEAEFTDSGIRKHRPESFAGKIGHLVAHKVDVVVRRGVGAALKACSEVRIRPTGGASDDRHPVIPEGSEETGGRMREAFEARGEVTLAPGGGNVGGPGGGGMQTEQGRGHKLT
jgi:hypothetical protein